MKKNKRIFAFIFAIVLFLSVIGLGGKVLIDKREEKKEQKLLAVEKQSVKVLKNTFENITEIKFNEVGKNEITGSYGMYITMKNNKEKQVSFSFTFWEESKKIGSYVINDRDVQKEGITTSKVLVIFTDDSEEKL
ncbi:hypothetical protein [Enterococcus rivorum]|uniref:DUF1433 domain-containing protein n=1 Tax=Enterococcus rivorum TaxID=762845 RepID=A0A1E5KZ62_9ENTE|nr:hypothetical protein [Enterococcus rivorum]MBP2097653.1 hypothetical protein [Enterococcus rivorum]OEH83093.1 hypothetical protein BCR26_02155 [Enterococcus rivorum]